MLSKLVRSSLLRRFATANTPATRSAVATQITENLNVQQDNSLAVSSAESSELQGVVKSERSHLQFCVNEIKNELNDKININFEIEKDNKTLIFETVSEGNYWKLGEVLTLAGAANLLNELAGFPSYSALGLSLGVAGLGGLWSYANFLRRSAPQITQIYRTSDGKLSINYLKPSGLFNRKASSFEVEPSHFRITSFGSSVENWVRKANYTSWVKIEGTLYWYNSNPAVLRTNSHAYSQLI